MDPPDNGTAAAALEPRYGHTLPCLPELDRPPALLTIPELEAVAAALPGKKRRLREAFERLAASSPAPLPFRWEDLDSNLSSFQYSATLRFRQHQEFQVPFPTPVPVHAAVPIPATTDDGAVEKGKKRKASSLVVDRSDEAHEEIRRVDKDEAAIQKACPLQDMDGHGTRLCPTLPGGVAGLAEAHGSTDTTVLLDSVAKIAVVRLEDPAATRGPSKAASLVQAGAPNPTSQRRHPPRPVPAPAVVSAPAVAGGDVEKAKQSDVERKVQKISVSMSCKSGEAKASPSPPADDVGNTFASAKASMQVDRPVCKIKAVEHELCAATCGASLAATNIMLPLVLDSPSLLVSLFPKPESSVGAADVDVRVVVAEERIHEVIKVDTPATPMGNASSPLQVDDQKAYTVSPLPLSSSNGFEEDGAEAGTAMLAETVHNTCVQQNSAAVTSLDRKLRPENSPETPKLLQAKGPNANLLVLQQQHISEVRISKAEKQKKLFSRNHGDRAWCSNPVLKAQEGVQRLTKEPGFGKGDARQDTPAAGRDPLLPNDSRNNGSGKGKPRVNESSESSKISCKFCPKCGSKGHVTHKCHTPKHLVELYLKHKKEKVANRTCFKCGTKGHIAIKCRTPRHLVDLYQNHRAALKASL